MKYFIMTAAALALTGCATAGGQGTTSNAPSNTKHAQPIIGHPDATPFVATANAKADVAEALRVAKAEDKFGLIVMGANWCHDSRSLAGLFQTPRFQTLLGDNYSLAYVDVGQKDKNLDVAKDFGLSTIEGTPTVFVTSSSGKVLNLDDAPTWRDAASRDSDDIYAYFAKYTGQS